eukprot:364240-Chlamydomonas_euryale.AAC.4
MQSLSKCSVIAMNSTLCMHAWRAWHACMYANVRAWAHMHGARANPHSTCALASMCSAARVMPAACSAEATAPPMSGSAQAECARRVAE